MPRHPIAILLVALALAAAPSLRAAEPEKKDEDPTQLKTYEVGGRSKQTPKEEGGVVSIEKPKIDLGVSIEKPKIKVAVEPFTVTAVAPRVDPKATRPQPATTPAPSAQAPVRTAPVASAPAPTRTAPAPAVAKVPINTAPARSNVGAGSTAAVPPAAPAAAGGDVPRVDTPTAPRTLSLIPISLDPPEYPRDALLSQTEGYVVIEFTVAADGSTQDIKVVESKPVRTFDQSARRAVARWRFEPIVEDGVKVEPRVQRRVDFKL